jgi:hypothetical protein
LQPLLKRAIAELNFENHFFNYQRRFFCFFAEKNHSKFWYSKLLLYLCSPFARERGKKLENLDKIEDKIKVKITVYLRVNWNNFQA